MTAPQFGNSFKKHFLLDEKTHVNHGSYGAVPKAVFEGYKKKMLQDLEHPDYFLTLSIYPEMQRSIAAVAPLLNVDTTDLVFVQNATAGVNTVMQSLPFEKGDRILMASTIYGACKNTVEYVAARYGATITTVDLDYPLEDAEVVAKFEQELKTGAYKLCFVDAVTSMPGVRVPFEQIVSLCSKYGTLSLVDGAHSIGLIPLDIKAANPDFFTTNLHKWLYLPRGSAVLYVKKEHQEKIQPFPVSHIFFGHKFHEKFLYNGSNNYSSFLSVEDAIKFRNEVCGGEEAIRDYCFGLAKKVGDLFGDLVVENSTKTLTTSMINVKVPLDGEKLKFFTTNVEKPDFWPKVKDFLCSKQLQERQSYLPPAWTNGYLYVRMSCQIYNELDEYKPAYDNFVATLEDFYKSEIYAEYAI